MKIKTSSLQAFSGAIIAALGLQLCMSVAGAADPSTTAANYLATYQKAVLEAQQKVSEIENGSAYKKLQEDQEKFDNALIQAKAKKIFVPAGEMDVQTGGQGDNRTTRVKKVDINLFSWIKGAGTAQKEAEDQYWKVRKYEKDFLNPARDNLETAMKAQNDQGRKLQVLETKIMEQSVLRNMDEIKSVIGESKLQTEVLAAVYDQTRLGEYFKQKMAAMVESNSFCLAARQCANGGPSDQGEALINEIFAKENVGDAVKRINESSKSGKK